MQTLVEGRGLVESPRWHDGRLWFADWIAGEILAVDSAGRAEVMVRHGSLPLCFDFLPDGTRLLASGPLKALARVFPNGMAVTADNTTLLIAESHRGRLTAFDIDASGGPTGWTRAPTPACSVATSGSPRCSLQRPTGPA